MHRRAGICSRLRNSLGAVLDERKREGEEPQSWSSLSLFSVYIWYDLTPLPFVKERLQSCLQLSNGTDFSINRYGKLRMKGSPASMRRVLLAPSHNVEYDIPEIELEIWRSGRAGIFRARKQPLLVSQEQ